MDELSRRAVSLPTLLLLVILVGATAGIAGHRLGGAGEETGADGTRAAVKFTGVVASMYSTADGGCVRADPGQGPEVGADVNCGVSYSAPGTEVSVGDRVTAVSIETATGTGEAVDGYLLSTVRPAR